MGAFVWLLGQLETAVKYVLNNNLSFKKKKKRKTLGNIVQDKLYLYKRQHADDWNIFNPRFA